MRLMPYLCLDSEEVSNIVRVLTYTKRALPGIINITLSHTCSDNPTDHSCLPCYCEALEGSFYTPSQDPAPWFTSAVPASEEFLGFLASDITLNSPYSRNVTPRSGTGGFLGPLNIKHRVINVEGYMFATSSRGMSYGERWLYDVLGGGCTDCGGGTLEILPACPPEAATDPEEEESFRTMLEVGLIEGPEFERVVDAECTMQKCSFQLAAGQPYMYGPEEILLEEKLLSTDSDIGECVTYSTDDWVGDATTRLEIQNVSGADITAFSSHGKPVIITVKIYPYATLSDVSYDYPNPCTEFTITTLRNEETLVIDSRYRQVLVYDVGKKRYINGMDHISFKGLFQWGDIGPCVDAAICCKAYTNQDILFTVKAYRREL